MTSFLGNGPPPVPKSAPAPKSSSSKSGFFASGGGQALAGGMMDIFSGFSAQGAYNSEAGALQAQSNEALRSAQANAQVQADQVRQYAGNQQEEYASSGVTLAGTPAMVIADTYRRGQQEVDAITRQGRFQAQLLRANAKQSKSSGRNALLGGIAKAAFSIAKHL